MKNILQTFAFFILGALLWLLHWLPFAWLSAVGKALGTWLYPIIGRRRRVVLVNLALAFPHLSAQEREGIAREHFQWLVRSYLERGMLWWSSAATIRKHVRLHGIEHLPTQGSAVIAAIHFAGLDAAWTRLSLERNMAAIYSSQKNRMFENFVYRRRSRFGHQVGFARQGNIRPAVRALRQGKILYLLPDLDLGHQNSVFVDFFGVRTATVTALSDYARLGQAQVLPCIVRMLPGSEGYEVTLFPAWKDFPGASPEDDARRLNAFVETQILSMIPQYYWVHKRFKSRPAGEKSPY